MLTKFVAMKLPPYRLRVVKMLVFLANETESPAMVSMLKVEKAEVFGRVVVLVICIVPLPARKLLELLPSMILAHIKIPPKVISRMPAVVAVPKVKFSITVS
jgi:hypothetical protein